MTDAAVSHQNACRNPAATGNPASAARYSTTASNAAPIDPPTRCRIFTNDTTALGIDRSEVVRLIDGLEAAGFVIRTRDTTDRRKYRLSITQSGRAERRKTDELIEQAAERVLHRLDDEERRTLHRLALKALGEEV
jgi:hypothetical protein